MRVRRSLLNFATTALLMAVTMAVAFPAAPRLVAWLGVSVSGGVRVVNDAFGYLTLLELGLGGALAPILAGAVGRGDEGKVRETIAAGARAYLRVALGTILVGLALTPIVPRFARGLNLAEAADLRRAWIIQLAAFPPLVVLPLRTVVEARQLGYLINFLLLGQSLLITGLSLWLAWAGWGIAGQAWAQVVGVWTFSLVLSIAAFRAHPGLFRAVLATPTRPETRRALRGLSAPSLILNLSGRLGLLSDSLIVGGLLDTTRVTSLVFTQKLASMGQSLLLAVGNATWAALAELHARHDQETFNRRLIEMTRLVAILAAVGLAPATAYNRAFFRIWLGAKVAYGGDLVIVLASVNAVLLAEQSLWAWCFSATGKIRALAPVAVAQAILNIAVSLVLTTSLGISGPLLGSTAGFLLGMVVIPGMLRRAFGTPTIPLLSAFGVPFLAGCVSAWLFRMVAIAHEPAGWWSLSLQMAASALFVLALGVACLLSPEDRSLWRQRFAALRPSR